MPHFIKSPFSPPFLNPVACPLYADGVIGSSLPPVSDKLIAWLDGSNTDLTHKTDKINSYDFLMANCPYTAILDGEGNPVLDGAGDPIYSPELDTTGWECEYTAPASGQPGHTELLAIDDGTLYTGSTPNTLTKIIMEAIDNDQMIWDHNREALLIYDAPLVGDELQSVLLYCGKIQVMSYLGQPISFNGEQITTQIVVA